MLACWVSDRGACLFAFLQKLMQALQRNRSLVKLDLRDCVLGREGGQAVASMLRTNSSLGELSLWNTALRQEGASAIIRSLRDNHSLQRLDLGCNELGPEVSSRLACWPRCGCLPGMPWRQHTIIQRSCWFFELWQQSLWQQCSLTVGPLKGTLTCD